MRMTDLWDLDVIDFESGLLDAAADAANWAFQAGVDRDVTLTHYPALISPLPAPS
jgi:hypothetical protein